MSVDGIMKDLLLHPSIRVKDPVKVEGILNDIITGGAEKLQLISDFDQTLTKHHENGETCLTTFGMFHSIPELPEGYMDAATDLYHRYHHYEVHPELTIEEKTPFMEQWYRESEELLKGCDVSAEHLRNQVHKCKTCFRDGSEGMFEALKKAEVPVLVFSAGVGDVVRVALEKHSMLHPNVRIISNFLYWEESGKLMGFQGDMIHVFNKNQRAVAAHEEYFSLLSHRPNVILMGDSEGDALMGHGIREPAAMIKIGFLYHNREERLEKFLEQFDIVLMDDQSMTVPIQMLKSIIGHQHFN